MGCLSRLGCLTVLVAAGAAGWWLYGGPLPKVAQRAGVRSTERLAPAPLQWATGDAASSRAADAVARLGAPGGPAYVRLAPGDVAGFLTSGLERIVPRGHGRVEVAIAGDRVHLRTAADLRALAGERLVGDRDGTLGRVLGALSGRDSLELAGTVSAVRPGLAQVHVRMVRIAGLELPPRTIPWLLGVLRRDGGLEGAGDVVPVPLPRGIGDVRVADGRITLYRAAP